MIAYNQTIRVPESHKMFIDIPQSINNNAIADVLVLIREKQKTSKKAPVSESKNDLLFGFCQE